ncbi:hypothetical protein PILCRDRAFT_570608 [Piloderma croceum F 1598]|uniref:Uncharacterized protein n=1 Tax=Piloderma croceum (strain F 1598) TaxID=765440 RepID=A0A0C3FHA2_PILCF|nr:hypothetical protein PILCRDRAFT_570608 [Piloderma croceum F 1598]
MTSSSSLYPPFLLLPIDRRRRRQFPFFASQYPLRQTIPMLISPLPSFHIDNNMGFKNFDPTHPCRQCWEQYSRPYVDAITYTPWSSSSASVSGSTSRSNAHFQRPLPAFNTSYTLHTSASQSHPPSQHACSVSSPNFPPLRIQYAPSPSPHPTSTPHAPPSGSTVVRPGDPRIGGTMCYKCLGSGVVQFFYI